MSELHFSQSQPKNQVYYGNAIANPGQIDNLASGKLGILLSNILSIDVDNLNFPFARESEQLNFGIHRISVLIDSPGLDCFGMQHNANYGPPRHIHKEQTEVFIIRSGRYEFIVGDQTISADTGDVVVVPPGIEHTFRCTEPTGGSTLVLLTPGGTADFFRKMSSALGSEIKQVAAEHGMEITGPPLPASTFWT